MSKQNTGARLNQGNHIYLYRLLRDALGCGKQTFMTQVEEALAAGDMAAVDLGFETTRELLEELDDCIKLTVFKGGRIYATVIANEQWDAALAKADEPKQKEAGKKQKSWKKKKGDKTIKAVRPKHVKRPEPEPVPEQEPETDTEPKPQPEANADVVGAKVGVGPEAAGEAETADATEPTEKVIVETAELINDELFSTEDEPVAERTSDIAEEAEANEPATIPETPQPKISLTVVYDPEHANAGVTTLESTPAEDSSKEVDTDTTGEGAETSTGAETPAEERATEAEPVAELQAAGSGKAGIKPESRPEQAAVQGPKVAAETEPQPKPAAKPRPKPIPASKPQPRLTHEPKEEPKAEPAPAGTESPVPELPKIPEDYPVDFALEVFCPGPLLHELSTYLPYGADVLGITGEYYWIARERGTIQASRNRATFPLRYTRDGKRHEVTIRIRRNTGGPGAAWAIDKIETPA